jgi:peptide/nickel transport system substrate-binding protein
MYAFLHSGAPLNEGHYNNAAFDSLLDQARQVTDVDTRRGIYQKAWTIAAEDLPITYLWTWKNMVGMSAKIQGFVPIPDGLIRVQGLQLAH